MKRWLSLLYLTWCSLSSVAAYRLYATRAHCVKNTYKVQSRDYAASIEACYQKCKMKTFFHYHIRGRGQCKSSGCKCSCYLKSDADGGCATTPSNGVDLFQIMNWLLGILWELHSVISPQTFGEEWKLWIWFAWGELIIYFAWGGKFLARKWDL